MKILIAVPCMDQVSAAFAQSLATLNKRGECTVSFVVASLIYDSRNKLAKQAISIGADYVMWFDSDMTFNPDTMIRLLEHLENGKDIVSGLYFRRTAPFTPVLYKTIEKGKIEGYNNYPKDSVFEIAGVGFGCIMMKTSVLYQIALEMGNWFEPMYSLGEDLAFCIRARECGFKIYCDSSIKCGHVGHAVITEDVYKSIGEPDVN